MIVSRIILGVFIAIGLLGVGTGAKLLWETPHCRPAPAHAYYMMPSVASCER
jgi:hypothetical protein